VDVGVGLGVSVGGIGVLVGVSEGGSVLVGVTEATTVALGIMVSVNGRVMMIGVAVTMLGVRDGMGVHTGNGWDGALKVSQAVRIKIKTSKADILFMILYSCIFAAWVADWVGK
jgi:hypothetical protein